MRKEDQDGNVDGGADDDGEDDDDDDDAGEDEDKDKDEDEHEDWDEDYDEDKDDDEDAAWACLKPIMSINIKRLYTASHSQVQTHYQRLCPRRPRSNYELFNRNNFSIRYWS